MILDRDAILNLLLSKLGINEESSMLHDAAALLVIGVLIIVSLAICLPVVALVQGTRWIVSKLSRLCVRL